MQQWAHDVCRVARTVCSTRQRLRVRRAGEAGGTRGPVGSFHGLSALQKRKTLAHRRPLGPRSWGPIRASGGSPPPNCPRSTDRLEGPRGTSSDTGRSKHSTVLKTNATQASVLPWKFYISLVYFFQIFSKILRRTCSHLTNVRLNRSEDMEWKEWQFKWSESRRYFLIIFLSKCIVDLKFCHVQNTIFLYLKYTFCIFFKEKKIFKKFKSKRRKPRKTWRENGRWGTKACLSPAVLFFFLPPQ